MIQIKVEAQLPFEQFIQPLEQLDSIELEQLVNQCIPLQLQERYDFLIGKRQDNTLTDEEYQELLDLGDRIEAIDVKRLEHLNELAKLRQTSLNSLIQETKIRHN